MHGRPGAPKGQARIRPLTRELMPVIFDFLVNQEFWQWLNTTTTSSSSAPVPGGYVAAIRAAQNLGCKHRLRRKP